MLTRQYLRRKTHHLRYAQFRTIMIIRFRIISRYWVIILLFSTLVQRARVYSASEESRHLVISNGGIIKLIVGLTMPVDLPIGLIWLQNFQFQYPMIDSASQLGYLNLLRNSPNRAVTRNAIYDTLAETWNRFGMNGTACVLRTICDVGRYSLSHNGIIGELLHTVFRPHKTSYKIYTTAKEFGRAGGRCEKEYSQCDNHFLDYFTS